MTTTNATSPLAPRKLRILMLHGYTQSGHLFEIKTKALKKSLEKHFPAAPKPGSLKQYPDGVELVYPTGPLRLSYADIPGHEVDGPVTEDLEAYGWWKRRSDGKPSSDEGMELGLSTVAAVLREQGPFDGALGFSQGAALASMLASLLEPGRREAFERQREAGGMPYPSSFILDAGSDGEAVHAPLKFAVSYSGFEAGSEPTYRAFYEPKIVTPMCHFIGSVDTVVSEERSLKLVDACVDGRNPMGGVDRVVYHPGGHFLPSSQKPCVAALVGFIREVLAEPAGSTTGSGVSTPRGVGEERVEDMDLPF